MVDSVTSSDEIFHLAKFQAFDVLLLDLNVKGLGGFGTAHKLLKSNSEIKIVLMAHHVHPLLVMRLLKCGLHGCVSKEIVYSELIAAIRAVHSDQTYLTDDIINAITADSTSPFSILSNNQLSLLFLICQGLSTHRIARLLCVSPKSINSYRHLLMRKLRMTNDIELVKAAIKDQLIKVDRLP